MEFSHKTMDIAIEQFFGTGVTPAGEMDFDSRRKAYFRWIDLSNLLIQSKLSDHLWSDRNFRLGYQLVLNIMEALDDNPRRGKFIPWNFVEDTLGEELNFTCEHPVETVSALIEGTKLAIDNNEEAVEEMSDETKENIMKDLKVLLVLAKMAAEFKKTKDTYSQELEAVMRGELNGSKTSKRKPVMEAA